MRRIKSHTLESKLISVGVFHVYCPIWTKFGLNVVLLTICEFCENWHAEGRTSHGQKWNYVYACIVKPYGILEVKNALLESVSSVTGYIICSLVVFGIIKVVYSSYLQSVVFICSVLDMTVYDSPIDQIPGSLPI
jgi:hypothetical protein